MEWVGPMICFRMELYGCFVRGKLAIISVTLVHLYIWFLECPEINNLSDNRTLLPDDNVYESSTYSAIVGTENDVREAWCAQGTDNTPNVILTFTQPLYITYATTRGVSIYWLREYSYYIAGSSGRSLYTDVDGTSVCEHLYLLMHIVSRLVTNSFKFCVVNDNGVLFAKEHICSDGWKMLSLNILQYFTVVMYFYYKIVLSQSLLWN